jgi:uridine phosphorylase
LIPESELIIRPDGSLYHLHLVPGQVAKTIITVGDPDRVSRVSERFDRVELKVEAREFLTHTGELNGKRLTVISTGIGTDNVDIVLNELDALFNVDLERRAIKDDLTQLEFIRLGTSGSFQPDLALDTFLLSEGALAADGLLPFYPGTEGDNDTGKELRDYLAQEGHTFPVPPVIVHPELPEALARDTELPRGITMSAAGFYGPQGRSVRLPSGLDPALLSVLRKWRHGGTRITNIEMETSGLFGLANALGHRSASLSVLLANRAEGTFSTQGKASVDRLIDRGLELLTA